MCFPTELKPFNSAQTSPAVPSSGTLWCHVVCGQSPVTGERDPRTRVLDQE